MNGRLALAMFGLGAALMLAFDSTLTRIAGVVCMLGGIAYGIFVIATPEFVAGEGDEEP